MVSKYAFKVHSNWLLLMLQVTFLLYLMLKSLVKMVVHVTTDLLIEWVEDLQVMMLLLLKSTLQIKWNLPIMLFQLDNLVLQCGCGLLSLFSFLLSSVPVL